jgi:hypothetical protein
MGLYTLEKRSFYFVHIPRTSGRFVRSLIENTEGIQCEYNTHGKEYVKDRDVGHLHYPLYEYYLPTENIPQITIVRNPLDKFISTIRCMYNMQGTDFNTLMETWDDFEKFVRLHIDCFSFKNNWFLPQSHFLSPTTKIWKYEDGINHDFIDWIYENTGIKISDDFSVKHKFLKNEKSLYKYPIDEHIKNYVYHFYYEDFVRFGYEYVGY